MSVRHSLLALLADTPTHGYGLKTAFEESTAGTWPLNVGQVYTTLNRLERDGLVRTAEGGQPDRQTWKITPQGKAALAEWYATPVDLDPPSRDELALKVLLAVAADAGEVDRILEAQRAATMERLQAYTRYLADADPAAELPWCLILDSLVLKAQAELAWIDRCEERLRATRRPRGKRS